MLAAVDGLFRKIANDRIWSRLPTLVRSPCTGRFRGHPHRCVRPVYLYPTMHVEHIAYAGTGRFAPAVLDHLANDVFIRRFLELPGDMDGLVKAAAARTFDPQHRTILCDALDVQHAALELHPAVRANLRRLREPQALTVTTGHQLCLFTGPLYVPYKILNAIRLARDAEARLSRPVVPVFWMASEDHDAAEIDHASMRGVTIRWNGSSGGAVGRMVLENMEATLDAAIEAIGPGAHASWLAGRLREAYAEGRTLAEATRRLVHDLFGHLGLVVLDGDDPALKRLFVPVMEQELLNRITHRTVSFANERIRERYPVQAHAREINIFHLRPGMRSRIMPDGDVFQVLDGGPRWTMDEVLARVHSDPRSFSPNVLLRPVYQESVLPNVAYIGGGGEVAYWLQLRWLFQSLQMPMPAIFLRTSASTISAKHHRQWTGLGLSVEELFAPLEPLKARVARRYTGHATDLDAERALLEQVHASLAAKARDGDASLVRAAEAWHTRALKGVGRLEQALVRAAKREQEVHLRRMELVHGAVFPAGNLQERHDCILPAVAAEGPALLDRWMDLLDPLDRRFAIVVQD